MKNVFVVITILFLERCDCFSQGFMNLNFENATIVPDNSQGIPFVYAANAIPGWTAYINGVPQADIVYNSQALSAASVNIEGTNNAGGLPLIQGRYFMFLQGARNFDPNHPVYTNSAGIGQVGQIPLTAMSLRFWGLSGLSTVSFGGTTLPLVILGSTPNYNIYGADVSAHSGQTGELLFTALHEQGAYIDNIQFVVPEPSSIALTITGVFLFGFYHRRKRK